MSDIQHRLVQILRKLVQNENIGRFARLDQSGSVDAVKELTFEISSKCDDLIGNSRAATEYSSPFRSSYSKGGKYTYRDDTSMNYASTADRSVILDEREGRMQACEEAIKYREQLLSAN